MLCSIAIVDKLSTLNDLSRMRDCGRFFSGDLGSFVSPFFPLSNCSNLTSRTLPTVNGDTAPRDEFGTAKSMTLLRLTPTGQRLQRLPSKWGEPQLGQMALPPWSESGFVISEPAKRTPSRGVIIREDSIRGASARDE
jgi:hypothetical protein